MRRAADRLRDQLMETRKLEAGPPLATQGPRARECGDPGPLPNPRGGHYLQPYSSPPTFGLFFLWSKEITMATGGGGVMPHLVVRPWQGDQ